MVVLVHKREKRPVSWVPYVRKAFWREFLLHGLGSLNDVCSFKTCSATFTLQISLTPSPYNIAHNLHISGKISTSGVNIPVGSDNLNDWYPRFTQLIHSDMTHVSRGHVKMKWHLFHRKLEKHSWSLRTGKLYSSVSVVCLFPAMSSLSWSWNTFLFLSHGENMISILRHAHFMIFHESTGYQGA